MWFFFYVFYIPSKGEIPNYMLFQIPILN
jgi:hypothetical protein